MLIKFEVGKTYKGTDGMLYYIVKKSEKSVWFRCQLCNNIHRRTIKKHYPKYLDENLCEVVPINKDINTKLFATDEFIS